MSDIILTEQSGDSSTPSSGKQAVYIKTDGSVNHKDDAGAVKILLDQKNNFSAIVAPAVTDDSSLGYEIGSVWIDTSASKIYTASDVTVGSAIWEQTGGVGTVTASQVSITTGVGSPTIDTVQENMDSTGSSGYFEGGILSTADSITLDVASGSGFIRDTADPLASLKSFKWSASLAIALTDNSANYVFVDNTGTVSISTSEFTEAENSIILGVSIKENGAIVSCFNFGVRLEESIAQAGRFLRRTLSISRDVRRGGLFLGESGTRNITLSTGHLWWGRTDYTITAVDTSVSGTFDAFYQNGTGGVTRESARTTWNNTQYDDGSGTLATLANNKWAVQWFFIEPDGHLSMVYGTTTNNSFADAELEKVPTVLPPRISATSILLGRLIFKKSDTTATIESAFNVTFAAGSTSGDMLVSTYDTATISEQLVGLTAVQTLTNKTLTIPVIDKISGSIVSGGGLILESTTNTTKATIQIGDATTGMFYDETNKRLSIGGTENTVVVGGTTFGADISTHSETGNLIDIATHRHTDTAGTGSRFVGTRSRGTEASEAVVQNGDEVFRLVGAGFDGTDYEISSQINMEIDGVAGSNDMPGRMVFCTTPNGGVAPIEAFRISQDKTSEFKGVVSGITPTADAHLATKGYVDGGKNIAINGSADIWQGGTSVAVPPSTKTYALDMFATYYAISNCTVSRQTADVDGTQYATRVQRNNGQTSISPIYHGQAFETAEIAKVRGKKLTFSVYLKKGADFSPTSGNLKMTLYTGTGSEMTRLQTAFTGEASAGTLTQALTTSAVRYTFTTTAVIPTATTQMALDFEFAPVGTAGVDDWFQWEKFQLEQGSIVSPFEFVSKAVALVTCYRHYWRSASPLSGLLNPYVFRAINTTTGVGGRNYPVPMRISPSIKLYGAAGTVGTVNEDGVGDTGATITASRNNNAGFSEILNSSTWGASATLRANVEADARL